MKQLIEKIEAEEKSIEIQKAKENEKSKLYRNFFDEDNYTTIKDLTNIDPCMLATIILAAHIPSDSINKAKDIIRKNNTIFENLDEKSLKNITSMIKVVMEDECLDDFKAVLKKEKSTKNPFNEEARFFNYVKIRLKTLRISQDNFAEYLELATIYPEQLEYIYETLLSLRKIKKQLKRNSEYEDISLQLIARQNKKDKMSSEELQLVSNVEAVTKAIAEAKRYYDKQQKAERIRQKGLTKAQEAYENLKQRLTMALSTNEEIKNPENIIGKELSPEIRLQSLKIIYKHNKSLHDQMEEEYKKLSANDTSKYKALLSEYGINVEGQELQAVMNNNLEDLQAMLQILKRLEIENPEELMQVVKTSNLQIVNNFVTIKERKIITSELLHQYMGLFDPTSTEYENFEKNFSYIQENKINPHYLSSNQYLFVMPHQVLSQNMDILKSYNYIATLKNTPDCSFLEKEDLAETIDRLLELGYEHNLEQTLELLNYKDEISRLQILKSLNIPVTSTEDLLEVMTTNKFFIPDSTIDNYVYNAVDFNLPCVVSTNSDPGTKDDISERLIDFENTERTYSFDGVLISKNKVLRNIEKLNRTIIFPPNDRLLYAIIKDSVLSDEECNTIKSKVNHRKTTGVVKQKV